MRFNNLDMIRIAGHRRLLHQAMTEAGVDMTPFPFMEPPTSNPPPEDRLPVEVGVEGVYFRCFPPVVHDVGDMVILTYPLPAGWYVVERGDLSNAWTEFLSEEYNACFKMGAPVEAALLGPLDAPTAALYREYNARCDVAAAEWTAYVEGTNFEGMSALVLEISNFDPALRAEIQKNYERLKG